MTILTRRAFAIFGLSAAALAGCARAPVHAPDEVSQLASGILALNPTIDPVEALRAADIGINYPKQLRREYGVTDSAIVHNIKVNAGTRPRGLCWHWAEDMQNRLEQENFKSLITHRAIANGHTRLLIDHSTVIVAGVGDEFDEGMVLDPWRFGGTLYWAPTTQDVKYTWVHRQEVFAWKRAQGRLKSNDPSAEPVPVS